MQLHTWILGVEVVAWRFGIHLRFDVWMDSGLRGRQKEDTRKRNDKTLFGTQVADQILKLVPNQDPTRCHKQNHSQIETS